jgi:hypothetical protein
VLFDLHIEGGPKRRPPSQERGVEYVLTDVWVRRGASFHNPSIALGREIIGCSAASDAWPISRGPIAPGRHVQAVSP